MLARKATTRICSFCKAPNPQRLTACYACGNSLAAINPNSAQQGEPTYPCLNCQGDIPYRANACPHCGRTVTPKRWSGEVVRITVSPEGWDVRSLPDSSVVVRRAGWNRWKTSTVSMLLPPGVLAVGLALGLFLPNGLIDRGDSTVPMVVPVFLFCAALPLIGLLLPLLMTDEVRVARDHIDVRRELWLYRFRRTIEGGFFTMKTELRIENEGKGTRERRYWVRRLLASNGGKPVLIMETINPMSWANDEFTDDEGARLALYLSHITGWRFYDEFAGRFGSGD